MKGHELLGQIVARLHHEYGICQTLQIVRVLAEEIGGVRISFPDIQELNRMERDRRIACEFNGANLDELALRYRLHRRQVRRIVRERC